MVPRDHVTVVWDRIEKYAEGCAKYTYGRFTAKDMLEGLLTKNQQLWIAFDDDGYSGFLGNRSLQTILKQECC